MSRECGMENDTKKIDSVFHSICLYLRTEASAGLTISHLSTNFHILVQVLELANLTGTNRSQKYYMKQIRKCLKKKDGMNRRVFRINIFLHSSAGLLLLPRVNSESYVN